MDLASALKKNVIHVAIRSLWIYINLEVEAVGASQLVLCAALPGFGYPGVRDLFLEAELETW